MKYFQMSYQCGFTANPGLKNDKVPEILCIHIHSEKIL